MRSSRISLALDRGDFADLPAAARIAVYRPLAGDDLSPLPVAQVEVISGFRPDIDYFAARGYAAGQGAGGPYGGAVVCLPRAKGAARALIARACREVAQGGTIAIDGQKTDGVESILRDCAAAGLNPSPALSKAHGKLFTIPAHPQAVPDWVATPQQADGFQTALGTFSADGPDAASVALAGVLPRKLGARVIDLGAGWGFLSRHILARETVTELDAVEAEADALACARVNLEDDPRARFHWADARQFKPARPAHSVVMNPPFHTGAKADPALGQAFIRAAAAMLVPDGTLWLVANRHLPYGDTLTTLFRQVEDLGGDAVFRLTRASHPQKTR